MSCGVGHRCGSDLVLLWLWHRQVATALIGSLAWELPYAAGLWHTAGFTSNLPNKFWGGNPSTPPAGNSETWYNFRTTDLKTIKAGVAIVVQQKQIR